MLHSRVDRNFVSNKRACVYVNKQTGKDKITSEEAGADGVPASGSLDGESCNSD